MPDVQELSDNDIGVAERMASLPDSVLFGEEEEDKKAGQERSDDPEAPNEIKDGPEAEEEAPELEAQAKTANQDEDPEFEIADPESGESRKLKLSELVEAEREYTAFKEQKTQILANVQNEAMTYAQGMVEQTRAQMTQVGHQLQAVLQHIQPPQPPPIDMLDPNSQRYNPDGYHLARAQHEHAMGRYNLVAQAAQGIAQQQAAFDEQRDTRELQKLSPHWPEFTDPVKGNAVQQEFVTGMNKAYGFTFAELDGILVDHRQAIVARDALKWREHQAKQTGAKVSLKEKVVAAKPAKQGQTQATKHTLTSEQSAHMNARKALKANGKDLNAAAKGFMRFL